MYLWQYYLCISVMSFRQDQRGVVFAYSNSKKKIMLYGYNSGLRILYYQLVKEGYWLILELQTQIWSGLNFSPSTACVEILLTVEEHVASHNNAGTAKWKTSVEKSCCQTNSGFQISLQYVPFVFFIF